MSIDQNYITPIHPELCKRAIVYRYTITDMTECGSTDVVTDVEYMNGQGDLGMVRLMGRWGRESIEEKILSMVLSNNDDDDRSTGSSWDILIYFFVTMLFLLFVVGHFSGD